MKKRVSFHECKLVDGFLTPGSVKVWVPGPPPPCIPGLLLKIARCVNQAALPQAQHLHRYFGSPRTAVPGSVDRDVFDQLLINFVNLAQQEIPSNLRKLVLAVRHEMPAGRTPSASPGCRIVCLFPVAPALQRVSWYGAVRYSSGWTTDGLFQWCGQRKHHGHLKVQSALEDCCGAHCAVLVFRRDKQDGPHKFVGRAQGYLPLAEQDSALDQPFRAGLLVDTQTPFKTPSLELYPGWTSPEKNKLSVWSALGIVPGRAHLFTSYSDSVISETCEAISRPAEAVAQLHVVKRRAAT